MDSVEIENRIRIIISGYTDMPVKWSSCFKELGLDSLDIIDVGMEIEEEFDIYIPDSSMDRLETVENAFNIVKSILRGKQ